MFNQIKITLLLLGAFTMTAGWAGQTGRFKVELKKGEHQNSYLKDGMFLCISPTSEKVYTVDEKVLWSSIKVGKHLLVGTGSEGHLHVIDMDTMKLVRILKLEETSEITSLLAGPNGKIFMGTGPNGKIYSLDKDLKTISLITTLPVQFIWSMDHDGQLLYIGSGKEGKGLLYRVPIAAHKWEKIFETTEKNILKVKFHDNKIYASTSGRGYLYEMSKEGDDVKILYETGHDINSFVLHKGSLYLGMSSSGKAKPLNRVPQPPSPSLNIPNNLPPGLTDEIKKQFGNIVTATNNPAQKVKAPNRGKTKVIDQAFIVQVSLTDRSARNVLTVRSNVKSSISSMHVNEADNKLYFGVYAGGASLIYAMNMKGFQKEEVLTVRQHSVTSFVGDQKETYFFTGNKGEIYRLKKDLKEATYTSEVMDAKETVQWGRMQYTAYEATDSKKHFKFYIRSGNTSTASQEGGWSDWNEVIHGEIGNTPSRFIQLKVVMTPINSSQSPMLADAYLYYGRKNLAAQITSVVYKKNKLFWNVNNPDKDRMSYSVYYTKDGMNGEWKLMQENVLQNNIPLNKSTLPDGIYQFKVVGDDILVNGSEHHLMTEKISPKYVIDNTDPEVIVQSKSSNRIEIRVRDDASHISAFRYSTGEKNQYYVVFPKDGVFDGQEEIFQIENVKASEIIIYVIDSKGNFVYKTIKINP